MKTHILLICLCLGSILPLSAQQFKRIFLFDDFMKAQIAFRNKAISFVTLNYDASNKIMLFQQEEDMMEITNTALIDTITVGRRKLVPATKGFHEVVHLDNGIVYIDWLLKDVNIGSKGALGYVTQGSVHNLQMSDLGLNGTEMYTPYASQKIGSTDVYRRKNDNTYYIKIDNKSVKIKSIKQLIKLYPNHKDKIEAYIKQEDIQMKDVSKVLMLLNYCLGLQP